MVDKNVKHKMNENSNRSAQCVRAESGAPNLKKCLLVTFGFFACPPPLNSFGIEFEVDKQVRMRKRIKKYVWLRNLNLNVLMLATKTGGGKFVK